MALADVAKADLVELKSFAKPPQAVTLVMESVCILMGRAPTWGDAKKLIGVSHWRRVFPCHSLLHRTHLMRVLLAQAPRRSCTA